MKKLNIRMRLVLSFSSIFLLIIILFAGISWQNRGVVKDYQEITEKYNAISFDVAKISGYSYEAHNKVAQALNQSKMSDTELQAYVKEFQATEKNIEAYKEDLEKIIDGSTMEGDFEVVLENFDKIRKTVDSMLEAVRSGNMKLVQEIYTDEYQVISEENDKLLESMGKASAKKADQMAKQADKNSIYSLYGSYVLVVIFAIIMFIIVVFTIRAIRIPLAEVVRAVKLLADGDVEARAAKINNDEIGEVADAVNALAEKNARAAGIAHQISEGDFTMEVSPETDVDVLGKAFKELVDGNNTILGEIRDAAAQVGAGSNQVAQASQSLAQGSTQQASAVQQVTAAINDITSKTKVNAEHAHRTNILVDQTKENAIHGSNDMKRMMHAMQEINQASENISKIIKTIDEIAFQTNILALNAAVEAARAGEHGKGFSVVAEEVRSLAVKSAEAASETAEMIEDSIEKVQNGSELAQLTADMLADIASSVEEIHGLTQEIADASNDQANNLDQVNQAVEQVSQVVQTNSATSEQCAAASEELSNQAKNLKFLIDKYKLRTMGMGHTTQMPVDFGMPETSEVSDNSVDVSQNSYDEPADLSNNSYKEPVVPQSFPMDASIHTSNIIPDAADFIAETDTAHNEQIISLEDDAYSKY